MAPYQGSKLEESTATEEVFPFIWGIIPYTGCPINAKILRTTGGGLEDIYRPFPMQSDFPLP